MVDEANYYQPTQKIILHRFPIGTMEDYGWFAVNSNI
jgi:hypothetical protein